MARPKLLSLISALVISVFITAFFAFYFMAGILIIIPFLLIFFVSFFIIYFLIERMIYKKIRDIHNGIQSSLNPGLLAAETVSPPGDALDLLDKDFKKWSQERKEEIFRLNKLENYRKEFLGNVSHELKTPIFNIQGYILTLLDGGLEDKTINRDYLQRAEKSVDRMIGIVADLESITQLESGELQLEIEKFDIVPLAAEVIDSLEMKAGEKKIKLLLRKYNENPVWVMGDKFRLRQVFLNLLENSIKYGKTEGESIINFRDAGEKIIMEIADNGIGIEKQYLPRIFERFFRIDKSRSREAGGTGLGLSIVEHIIEAHGQKITVISTPGVGTVFSFALLKAQ